MTLRNSIGFMAVALMALLSTSVPSASAKPQKSCGNIKPCEASLASSQLVPSSNRSEQANPKYLRWCTKGSLTNEVSRTILECESYLKIGRGNAYDQARAKYMLGQAYMRTPSGFGGSPGLAGNKSVDLWKSAANLDPHYIEPLLSLGRLYGLAGMTMESLDALAKAEELNPTDWRIYVYRSVPLGSMGNQQAALEEIEKAFKLNPQEPAVRRAYALRLQKLSRLDEAAAQYLFAAENYDPRNNTSLEFGEEQNAWISLAEVYGMMDKPAMAAAAMTRYIGESELTRKNFRFYELRANFYEQAGMYAEAAKDFEIAAAVAPLPFVKRLSDKKELLHARASGKQASGSDLDYKLSHGSLKLRLKVQVFLRNQGYWHVTVNGVFDEATRRALASCRLDKNCAPGLDRSI